MNDICEKFIHIGFRQAIPCSSIFISGPNIDGTCDFGMDVVYSVTQENKKETKSWSFCNGLSENFPRPEIDTIKCM
jgi:hypothetical protein